MTRITAILLGFICISPAIVHARGNSVSLEELSFTEYPLPAGSRPTSIVDSAIYPWFSPPEKRSVYFSEPGTMSIGELCLGCLPVGLDHLPVPIEPRVVGVYPPFPPAFGTSELWFTTPTGAAMLYQSGGGLYEENVPGVVEPHGLITDDGPVFTDRGGTIYFINTLGPPYQYPVPPGIEPYDLSDASDEPGTSEIWYTDYNSAIGKLGSPATPGPLYPLPQAGCQPRSITRGPDGRLWFVEAACGRIGAITIAGVIQEYSLPAGVKPVAITAADDGALWFTNETASIGRITTSGTIRLFAHDSPGTKHAGIARGLNRTIWFCEYSDPPGPGDKIVRVELPAACGIDARELCLGGGRFAVTTRWTAGGQSGDGMPVPLTADTGSFWFFAATNVEVVVKVLDACSISGHYWVFAGGLTDVLVDMTVRDTDTGEVRTYNNPQGVAFQPIQDTSAFATCL